MGRFAKKNVKSLEDVEKWLANERKIRFIFTKQENPKPTFDEIFEILIKEHDDTYRVRGGYHCGPGKDRSLQDLILITKYYYPEWSYIDIMSKVCNYYISQQKEEALFPTLGYCPDIDKYNFRISYYLEDNLDDYRFFIGKIRADLKYLFPNILESTRQEIYEILLKLWYEDVEEE